MKELIELKLGKTYYDKGMFYLKKKYTNLLLPKHESKITIQLGSKPDNNIEGIIDRNSQASKSPRIRTNGENKKKLIDWFHSNYILNDSMIIEVIKPNYILLRNKNTK